MPSLENESRSEQAAALRRDIARRLFFSNLDEIRVLDALLTRIEIGRERYGYLDLTKARDWDREEAEELLDMRIYQACRTLAEGDASLESGVFVDPSSGRRL